jgi:hypothetical protein
MPTNKEAVDKLLEAYTVLLLTYQGKDCSADKQRITRAAKAIYAEYNEVFKQAPFTSYRELTGKLRSVTGSLERIRKDHYRLANTLVRETRIFQSLSEVLQLIT